MKGLMSSTYKHKEKQGRNKKRTSRPERDAVEEKRLALFIVSFHQR